MKNSAFFELMILLGISLEAVLGFFLSISLSIYLLNAIAAFLALIIHTNIFKNNVISKLVWLILNPNDIPNNAKGNAKIV